MAIHYVPIIRNDTDQHAENHLTIVLDANTGQRIGHSPTHTITQTLHRTKNDTIKTTLTITRKGANPC